ncbi:hypothetical protein LIER_17637 [Lithospermum erythrorhizon]|uniref:Nodulin-like domain-containing protein n=1 Tax=Lithospermum erythrorhizon TaxID=34254 RepID=A0AAV3QDS6_LITER
MSESSLEDPDFNPPLKSILFNKWTSTVSSIWIQSTSGSLYTFSLYSQSLKTTQSYTQSTLNLISFFKDFGGNSGILSGVLYNFTGPWGVILCGAVFCFVGYFFMWLSVVGLLPKQHVLVICGFMFVAAQSSTFFNTANVVTGVNNFPNHRGTIVGIMKGFLGLSGAILIQVYQIIFKNKPATFLLMLALLPTINSLLLMFFVQIFKRTELEEKKHLNGFSLFSVVIAIYLMAIIIIQNLISLRMTVRVVSFVALIILLLSILSVVFKAEGAKTYRKIRLLLERDELTSEPDQTNQLNSQSVNIGDNSNRYREVPGGPEDRTDTGEQLNMLQQRSLNLLQAMCTSNFWFLIITTGCGMGSGLATVNNLGQIGASLGYSSLQTSTLVSLWNIWNFFGRFGGGYVSDYFIHSKGWSRPLFMAITLAGMSLGYVILASGMSGAVYIGSVLVGICYGSQWSLMPTIASELFGKVHFGTIFNTITIANPIGSYVFSVKVMGYIYDKGASEEGNLCTGTYCYMLSFYVMAGATFFGFLVSLVLFYRTRNFYTHVVVRTLSVNKRAVADIRG